MGNLRHEVRHSEKLQHLRSSTLAILCMDRFERLHIYQELHSQLTIYIRYIGDISTVTTEIEQASTILTHMSEKVENCRSFAQLTMPTWTNYTWPTIHFEMETPTLTDTYRSLTSNWTLTDMVTFSKPVSKDITINFHSHRRSSVKRAVVANELERAELWASAEPRCELYSGHTNKTHPQQLPTKLDKTSNTTPTTKEITQTKNIHFQQPTGKAHARKKPATLLELASDLLSCIKFRAPSMVTSRWAWQHKSNMTMPGNTWLVLKSAPNLASALGSRALLHQAPQTKGRKGPTKSSSLRLWSAVSAVAPYIYTSKKRWPSSHSSHHWIDGRSIWEFERASFWTDLV